MTSMQKLLVIVGPTSSGKSDLAVFLAKKFRGEVVSADSRQVYKGLDIGTGKITKREMRGIPHHLIDILSPKKQCTVTHYKVLADAAIAGIAARDTLPILCGGTGLYIDAVVDNFALPEVPPDPLLRAQLEGMPPPQLFALLEQLDPARAQTIDRHNPRRLVRAIEIACELGAVPTLIREQRFDTLEIGILVGFEKLHAKIIERLHMRLRRNMIAEAIELHKAGVSWKRMENLGLEYRYLARFLQKEISKQEMITQLEKEIIQYAKRQMTWLRKNKRIIWIDPVQERMRIISLVEKWLSAPHIDI